MCCDEANASLLSQLFGFRIIINTLTEKRSDGLIWSDIFDDIHKMSLCAGL